MPRLLTQGGVAVIKHYLLGALAALAVTLVVPAAAQINTGGIVNFDRSVFNLAEAYPCTVGTYDAALGIADPRTYCGNTFKSMPPGAAPGILSLARSGFALDVNCFVVAPENAVSCFVQSYRFFKFVPGSFKCPDVYGLPHFDDKGNLVPYMYSQFGAGVRTWWSLNFTQPGTRFLLQVISVCQVPRSVGGGRTINVGEIHMDSWRWRVVADVNTLGHVINLMHGGAISTLEVPCILGEDMYEALVNAQQRLAKALNNPVDPDDPFTPQLMRISNAIFDFEALVVANCLFVEVLNPLIAFPGPRQFGAPNFQPPGNLAQTIFFGQGSAVAGIIDTIENPCCCKLIVDLEWIAIKSGVGGDGLTLPVF
jgi:hypothetical protein